MSGIEARLADLARQRSKAGKISFLQSPNLPGSKRGSVEIKRGSKAPIHEWRGVLGASPRDYKGGE